MAGVIVQPGTGLQGPAGPTGATGPAGATGATGPAGPAGGAVASAAEVEVTVTTGQTVLTYTPTTSGPFLIGLYLRVITAATTVSAVVTYTDATGAQSKTLQASGSLAVGSYPLDSITIDALAGDAIDVVVTAGTADQVYASAAIWSAVAGEAAMTNPMTTLNDLIVGGASGVPTRLGVGLTGQVLKVLGGAGQAVLFNGSTGYVQAPYVQPALATLSFMVWLYVPSSGIGESNPALFGTAGFFGTATGCGLGYNLGTSGNTNAGVDFALNATSGVTVTDPTIPTTGVWYCYVCTYDGSTMTMYRQGSSVASAANSGSCVASTTDLLIATAPSRTNRYWGGELAHIAFWPGVVLTATNASDLFSNASTMTEAEYEAFVEGLSPALYYPLQDSTITAVNKGTLGSADNGAYNGGYTQGVAGPVTTATAPYIGWG